MNDRIRIGVVGCGLISQVEHIPNVLALKSKFELRGVSDPSASVRAAMSEKFATKAVASPDELIALDLDALLIATPDSWHGVLAERAMRAGLHVFSEKPLCYGVAEIDSLAKVQEETGKLLQVGYMKRFDPSYEQACALIGGRGDKLRFLSVEVNDPDAWPFVAHHSLVSGHDVSADIIAETQRRRRDQVHAALGFEPEPVMFKGFAGAYCSALVHDVNAVHGLLSAMEMEVGRVQGASIFAGGGGGHASIALRKGEALWTMNYIEVPKVADYCERISLYFDDEILDLIFPAPYLNHHPTKLVRRRSNGAVLETTAIRTDYSEAFVRELEGFHAAVAGKGPLRNPISDARRDQALLVAMARRVAGHDTRLVGDDALQGAL